MKTAMAVFGALIGAVVILTFLTGGSLNLGTGPQGPSFGLGFSGRGFAAR